MKKMLCLFLVFIAFLLISLNTKPAKKSMVIEPGTYAFQWEDEQVLTALVIEADQHFVYFDKTTGKEIKGTWKIVKGDLLLEGESPLPITDKWKIDKNGKCLKSRDKMAFYRFCNC